MSEDRRRTKKQPIDPTYGHIQPQAPEVEKAVLGALMIDKDAYVEVCEIPRVLSSSLDKEKVIESVDHLVNPLDNAINEKCSRIKKVFLSMMDEYSASYYFISSHTLKHIQGSSRIWYERLKVITLPRELVIWK